MREKTNHGRQTPSASSLGVDRWRVDQEVQREAMKLARKMPKELPRGSATEKGDSGRIEPLWEKTQAARQLGPTFDTYWHFLAE